MIYYDDYQSIVGNLRIVSDGKDIIGLFIEGQKYFMNNINGKLIRKNIDAISKTKKWLDDYFNCKRPNPKDLSLNPFGTPFQKRVWQILLEIPYGEVTTYKEITKKIEEQTNKRMSSQAVGGAVSRNPISIIIPCHRVVGSNGTLVGYAGGLDKKKKLLDLEKNK